MLGRSTLQAAFLLRHCVEAAKVARQQLFSVFIDFQAAYAYHVEDAFPDDTLRMNQRRDRGVLTLACLGIDGTPSALKLLHGLPREDVMSPAWTSC